MPSSTRSIATDAVAGLTAFVVGYLLTYLARGESVRETLGGVNALAEFLGGDPIPAWKVVGWLHFNAHLVDTKLEFGPVGPRFVNLLRAGDADPTLVYAIPPVVLVAAGLLVAWTRGPGDGRSIVGSVAAITAGYAVTAATAAVTFRVGASGPDLVPAVLLAGILYPAVFTGVGVGLFVLTDRVT